jgi:hypothetical protein
MRIPISKHSISLREERGTGEIVRINLSELKVEVEEMPAEYFRREGGAQLGRFDVCRGYLL